MSIYYYPQGDPDFIGVISYSPLHRVVCQRKPFGQISAEEYFEYAQEDILRDTNARLVNALGNAKRCFHYQIDRLLYRFSLNNVTARSKFPKKIELLKDLRIVSGALLRKFNRERNAMEHDYLTPKKEDVEGAIDLCELLLLATERYLQNTPSRIRVVLADDPRDLILSLTPGGNCIRKFIVEGTSLQETKYGKVYRELLFKFETKNELADGISIKELPGEAIPIKLHNKETWLPILRMFSVSARNSTGHLQCPTEPMVSIQHFIPLRIAEKMFESIRSRRGKK